MRDPDRIGLHPLLRCFAERVDYDFASRTGRVHVGLAGGWPDLDGAVRLFTGIDPGALRIVTVTPPRGRLPARKDGDWPTEFVRDRDVWRARIADETEQETKT